MQSPFVHPGPCGLGVPASSCFSASGRVVSPSPRSRFGLLPCWDSRAELASFRGFPPAGFFARGRVLAQAPNWLRFAEPLWFNRAPASRLRPVPSLGLSCPPSPSGPAASSRTRRRESASSSEHPASGLRFRNLPSCLGLRLIRRWPSLRPLLRGRLGSRRRRPCIPSGLASFRGIALALWPLVSSSAVRRMMLCLGRSGVPLVAPLSGVMLCLGRSGVPLLFLLAILHRAFVIRP